jgi:riboflavin biosynthesis pyrimidine reductase
VDEVSVAICPAIDGAQGAPSVFDSRGPDAEVRAPLAAVTLEKSAVLEGGTVWLRYRVENA